MTRAKNALLIALIGLSIWLGCDSKDDSREATPRDSGTKDSVTESKRERAQHSPIGIQCWLTRGFDSGWGARGGGYIYSGEMQIGNPNRSPFRFDSLNIEYKSSLIERSPVCLTGQLIAFTDGKITVFFRYGHEEVVIPEDEKPTVQIIEGNRAIRFDFNTSSALIPTICGGEPTTVEATLLLKGKRVSQTYKGVLPPLMKIPDEYRISQKGVSLEENKYHMILLPASYLPAPSGVIEKDTVSAVFRKAATISPGTVLVKVRPEIMTLSFYTGGKSRLLPGVWLYHFWSPQSIFSIHAIDPGVAEKSEEKPGAKPEIVVDTQLLESCRLDCDTVALLLEAMNAKPGGKGTSYELIAIMLNRKKRPLWDVSYYANGRRVGVLADTGEIVFKENGSWKLATDVIWNK